MSFELAMLAASCALCLIHIVVSSDATSMQRGYRWAAMNWPPFRPDTRHNLEGLRLSSSTGLCLTTTNVSS